MSERCMFVLTKFSKAISGPQNSKQSNEVDWQHYTQPTLRLLWEWQRSPHGAPTSARLRIAWTVERLGNHSKTTQENVILEDMDMILIRQHVHPFPMQGLPLKAVYRDSLVGIRYLPVQARSNSSSEYRRFQMSFQTTTAAAEFVEKISTICPCKLSPTNAAAAPGLSGQAAPYAYTKVPIANQGSHEAASGDPFTESQPLPFPFVGQSQVYQRPAPRRLESSGYPTPQCSDDSMLSSSQITNTTLNLPNGFSALTRHPTETTALSRTVSQASFRLPTSDVSTTESIIRNLEPSPTIGPTSDRQEALLSPFDQQANAHTNPLVRSRTIAQSFETSMNDFQVHRSDTYLPPEPGHTIEQSRRPAQTTIGDGDESRLSVPSALTKTKKSSAAPGQRVSETTDASSKGSDPLVESLYEACNLDHLPADDLEKLIAHIIREDGFAQLLEKLDNSWRLKGLVSM